MMTLNVPVSAAGVAFVFATKSACAAMAFLKSSRTAAEIFFSDASDSGIKAGGIALKLANAICVFCG